MLRERTIATSILLIISCMQAKISKPCQNVEKNNYVNSVIVMLLLIVMPMLNSIIYRTFNYLYWEFTTQIDHF